MINDSSANLMGHIYYIVPTYIILILSICIDISGWKIESFQIEKLWS